MRNEVMKEVDVVIESFAKARGKELPKDMDINSLISDSLDMMRFFVALEEHFDVYIDQDYLFDDVLTSKDKIVDMILNIKDEE